MIITTRPVATVYIDGKATRRKTPITPNAPLTLSPGMHTVRLVAGGRRFEYRVTIVSGATARLVRVLPLP